VDSEIGIPVFGHDQYARMAASTDRVHQRFRVIRAPDLSRGIDQDTSASV
jgi:hypothetical protein